MHLRPARSEERRPREVRRLPELPAALTPALIRETLQRRGSDVDASADRNHPPAWERFLKFLAEGAVRQWMKERDARLRRREPIDAAPDPKPARKWKTASACETIIVEEAVARDGLSREQITADFEQERILFEVELR